MTLNLANMDKLPVTLPKYDVAAVRAATKNEPVWLHFGAGNIFRGLIASVAQKLLNEGLAEKGITAVETYDNEIIEKIFDPHDNLTLNVTLIADGTMECEVHASVTEGLDVKKESGRERLKEIFCSHPLQIVSFTITEKGYAIKDASGNFLPSYEHHVLSYVVHMLHERFKAGGSPIALLSLDNCSKNGQKLREAVIELAEHLSYDTDGFTEYLRDEFLVAFPWSMVDKITPGPSEDVAAYLAEKGITGMKPFLTNKGTLVAPFVNAEITEYLVVEDAFPNGRPQLERVGVLLTDRETVNKTERVKVTTCLNPLHTAMAIYGCLLGYNKISDEMGDEDIVKLIERLGYTEGLPVATDPGIIGPKAFLDELLKERLPNPFMGDTPQRISTDTSQKVGIRFGETIKTYIKEGRGLNELISIPLAIAGWLRYLLGVDDSGREMKVSPDPLKEMLDEKLSGIIWNRPESYKGQLMALLSMENIFGLDLTKTSLAGRIEGYFVSMLEGAGAVRKTLGGSL